MGEWDWLLYYGGRVEVLEPPELRETRWHRSERVEEQPDGSLVWRAQVAEPHWTAQLYPTL